MTNLSGIIQTVLKIYPFTGEQLELLKALLSIRTLSKKELLIKPGKVCSFITYVNTGSLRQFTDAEGKEQTIHFFTENMWAADADSFFTQAPSRLYIEAIEPAGIIVLSIFDFHALMHKDPAFGILGKVMHDWSISTSRLLSLSSMSPDERYAELMRTHPEWINRFPQHQIASYLGMTPETLSRVRSRV